MSDKLTIRPPRPDDHDQWLTLWHAYNVFYGRRGEPPVEPEVTAATWGRFFDAYEPLWARVAEVNGQLVGLVHYLFHRNTNMVQPVCYLEDLFTAEAARGQGVGRALIDAVYAEARAAGLSRVYWLTQEGNVPARRLYDQVAEKSDFIVYRKDL